MVVYKYAKQKVEFVYFEKKPTIPLTFLNIFTILNTLVV